MSIHFMATYIDDAHCVISARRTGQQIADANFHDGIWSTTLRPTVRWLTTEGLEIFADQPSVEALLQQIARWGDDSTARHS